MRRTRQARLDSLDAEVRLAQTTANFRVLPKAFLSASALGSWSFCHTKPFVERMLQAVGIEAETVEMRAGTVAHEELQGALAEAGVESTLTMREAIDRQEFWYGHEDPLKDERRMLRGIADVVFTTHGVPYIIELKNTVPPNRPDPVWGAPLWFEHGLQLQFYALMGRADFGRPAHLGLAYLKRGAKEAVMSDLAASGDPERALLDLYATGVQVEPTPESKDVVDREIKGFRRAERALTVPTPNHANPRRCSTCRVRTWCPRRLDQPGNFETIPAERLEPNP